MFNSIYILLLNYQKDKIRKLWNFKIKLNNQGSCGIISNFTYYYSNVISILNISNNKQLLLKKRYLDYLHYDCNLLPWNKITIKNNDLWYWTSVNKVITFEILPEAPFLPYNRFTLAYKFKFKIIGNMFFL